MNGNGFSINKKAIEHLLMLAIEAHFKLMNNITTPALTNWTPLRYRNALQLITSQRIFLFPFFTLCLRWMSCHSDVCIIHIHIKK